MNLKSLDTQYSRSMIMHLTIQCNIMLIANEYMNSQKRYDYAMIEFVSDDSTIATCPAMILGLGSTKRTLCGIVLFKLNTFFSHVFAGP